MCFKLHVTTSTSPSHTPPDSVNGVYFIILPKLHPKNAQYDQHSWKSSDHVETIWVSVTDKEKQLALLGATKRPLTQIEK